jgi:protein-S-isoprenylcysteine O-methyltransferase Ste14
VAVRRTRPQSIILGLFVALFVSTLIGVAVHPSLETAFAVSLVGIQLAVLLWMTRRARP